MVLYYFQLFFFEELKVVFGSIQHYTVKNTSAMYETLNEFIPYSVIISVILRLQRVV